WKFIPRRLPRTSFGEREGSHGRETTDRLHEPAYPVLAAEGEATAALAVGTHLGSCTGSHRGDLLAPDLAPAVHLAGQLRAAHCRDERGGGGGPYPRPARELRFLCE